MDIQIGALSVHKKFDSDMSYQFKCFVSLFEHSHTTNLFSVLQNMKERYDL